MSRRKQIIEDVQLSTKNTFIVNKIKDCSDIYEINEYMTDDVAEAVAIMMRRFRDNDLFWDTRITIDDITTLTPEKSLYWLTGGDEEWISLKHYNKPWSECYLDFQKEFGFDILKSVKDAKTLRDIKRNFIKYLDLPTLYDFALSKNLVR